MISIDEWLELVEPSGYCISEDGTDVVFCGDCPFGASLGNSECLTLNSQIHNSSTRQVCQILYKKYNPSRKIEKLL